EYVGHRVLDFHTNPARVSAMLALLARGGAIEGFEAQLLARDGSTRDVLIDASGLIRDGSLVYARGVTRANTRTTANQAALEASEERFRLMLDTANEGVLIIDGDARITYANDQLAAILGYDRQTLTGMLLFDLMDRDMAAESARRLERRRDGTAEQF